MKFQNVKNKVMFFHSILYLRKFKLNIFILELIFGIRNIKKYIIIAKENGFTGNVLQLKPFLDDNKITELQIILNKLIYKYGLNLSYKEYRTQVDLLSNMTYRKYKNSINPKNLKRGQYFYHLHHKFTVMDGFKNKISPDIIACSNNLKMVWWKDNISIGEKSEITLDELLNSGQ